MTADTREKIDLWYLKQLTARRAERDQCAGWLYRSIASDQVEQLHYERSRARRSPFPDLILAVITARPDDVEAWRSALRMGVDALGLTPAGLSERFAASIPSVQGWLDGTGQPVWELRSLVLGYLLEQALADRSVPTPAPVSSDLASTAATPHPVDRHPLAAAGATVAEHFQHGYAAGLRGGPQIAKDLGWVSDESLMPRIVWDDVVREIGARINAVLAATSKTPDR